MIVRKIADLDPFKILYILHLLIYNNVEKCARIKIAHISQPLNKCVFTILHMAYVFSELQVNVLHASHATLNVIQISSLLIIVSLPKAAMKTKKDE